MSIHETYLLGGEQMRLVDAEHSLKFDGRYLDAADIREAVELLESYNLGGA